LAGREVLHQHGDVADAATEFFRERVEHILHDFDELYALHASPAATK
jgi:predicted transcriptional regulator YheO